MLCDFVRGQEVVVTSQPTGISILQLTGKHVTYQVLLEKIFYSEFFRTLLSITFV